MEHVKDITLVCLMLLDIFPDLDIRGVDYIDTKLLAGTEHEHLLEDIDNINVLEAGEVKTESEEMKPIKVRTEPGETETKTELRRS